jgi:hypothetical protein
VMPMRATNAMRGELDAGTNCMRPFMLVYPHGISTLTRRMATDATVALAFMPFCAGRP